MFGKKKKKVKDTEKEKIVDDGSYGVIGEIHITSSYMSDEEKVDSLKREITDFDKSVAQLEKAHMSDEEKVDSLKREITELKCEAERLKSKKKIEEEEIKHLIIKLRTEALSIEAQKKELELQSQFQKKEIDLQKSYFDKSVAQLEKARMEMKEVCEKIIERLPNVNMSIQQKVVPCRSRYTGPEAGKHCKEAASFLDELRVVDCSQA